MFKIRNATTADISLIRDLTYQVWPQTYSAIIPKAQIDYMLLMMYSEESLKRQMEEEHCQFVLIYNDEAPVGFVSISEIAPHVFKLHKIYVLISEQGKGTGKYLLGYVLEEVAKRGGRSLELQVNKNNSARQFYEKLGFIQSREIDLDIGSGFFMNDYIMVKEIGPQSS